MWTVFNSLPLSFLSLSLLREMYLLTVIFNGLPITTVKQSGTIRIKQNCSGTSSKNNVYLPLINGYPVCRGKPFVTSDVSNTIL